MIRYCQQDPRWSSMKLAPSSLTMGRYGCLTTAVCMIADKFRRAVRPDVALRKGLFGYTKEGLFIWEAMKIEGLKFVKRIRYEDKEAIREAASDWRKGVILAVNNDAHFVAVRGRIPFTNHYFVNDPWDGKVKTTYSYYNISGCAIIEGERR